MLLLENKTLVEQLAAFKMLVQKGEANYIWMALDYLKGKGNSDEVIFSVITPSDIQAGIAMTSYHVGVASFHADPRLGYSALEGSKNLRELDRFVALCRTHKAFAVAESDIQKFKENVAEFFELDPACIKDITIGTFIEISLLPFHRIDKRRIDAILKERQLTLGRVDSEGLDGTHIRGVLYDQFKVALDKWKEDKAEPSSLENRFKKTQLSGFSFKRNVIRVSLFEQMLTPIGDDEDEDTGITFIPQNS